MIFFNKSTLTSFLCLFCFTVTFPAFGRRVTVMEHFNIEGKVEFWTCPRGVKRRDFIQTPSKCSPSFTPNLSFDPSSLKFHPGLRTLGGIASAVGYAAAGEAAKRGIRSLLSDRQYFGISFNSEYFRPRHLYFQTPTWKVALAKMIARSLRFLPFVGLGIPVAMEVMEVQSDINPFYLGRKADVTGRVEVNLVTEAMMSKGIVLAHRFETIESANNFLQIIAELMDVEYAFEPIPHDGFK